MQDPDQIRLSLPALAGYARIARLAMTGLASRNGFSYAEVEDLRIATGELFGALVEPESGEDRVVLACTLPGEEMAIEAHREPRRALPEVGELTWRILAAVVDAVEVDTDAGRLRITKQARSGR